jgi:thioredoxin 1
MSGINEIAENGFQQEVLNSKQPVLVDFYAPWCGPCRALAPALEAIAKAYDGRLKVVTVNVDDAPGLAARYGIRGVPTMMFFKGGSAVDSIVGLPPASHLKSRIEAIAASPARAAA